MVKWEDIERPGISRDHEHIFLPVCVHAWAIALMNNVQKLPKGQIALLLWNQLCLCCTDNLFWCKPELELQCLEWGRRPKGAHPNDPPLQTCVMCPAKRLTVGCTRILFMRRSNISRSFASPTRVTFQPYAMKRVAT